MTRTYRYGCEDGRRQVNTMGNVQTEKSSHVIPTITHELGSYWKQPSLDRILVDDSVAMMSRQTMNELRDYSCSIPTGAYEGKMWRFLDSRSHEWCLAWYGFPTNGNPDCVSINKRRIVFVEDSPASSSPLAVASAPSLADNESKESESSSKETGKGGGSVTFTNDQLYAHAISRASRSEKLAARAKRKGNAGLERAHDLATQRWLAYAKLAVYNEPSPEDSNAKEEL